MAVLRGFKLTNGTGYPLFAQQLRMGGGILIYLDCNVSVINCEITKNRAAMGAGIFATDSSLYFSGLKIYNNYAIGMGGGILMWGSLSHYPTIVFEPINRCSVYENYGTNPVDIAVIDLRANLQIYLDLFTLGSANTFYVDRHSNFSEMNQYTDTVSILRGHRVEINHDLYVRPDGNDGNSGLSPAQAMKTITKAMHRVAADSLNRKTVYVLPGTYNEGAGEQIFPIPLKSHIKLIGSGSDQVTLYSDTHSLTISNIFGEFKSRNATVKGFRITEGNNIFRTAFHFGYLTTSLNLSDILIENMSVYRSGAIFVNRITSSVFDSIVLRNITTQETAVVMHDIISGTTIRNSVFENIHSTYSSPYTPGDDSWAMGVAHIKVSGSLSVENCGFRNISVMNNQYSFGIEIGDPIMNTIDVNVNNCLFENIRSNANRGVSFGNNSLGQYRVSDCTFYNNYGAVAAVGVHGKVDMRNNIFYNPDCANEIIMYPAIPQAGISGRLDFDYNNIRGGFSGIYNPDHRNTLIYGSNNTSADPMFAGTTAGEPDYLRLAQGSPCIDSGTPDTSGLELLPYDLAGNWRVWNGRIDMGCYEYGSEPWVSNDDPVVPPSLSGLSLYNYPNPFNPSTTICYRIPESGRVKLSIYNLKGQLVRILLNEPKQSGNHQLIWNGDDQAGNMVSSGVYFTRIESNGKSSMHKMLLVK
ncbi:MAG: T9SS type A sorting domain-containing protein [Candidatus Cloacimonadaceae bacterium]|nr:T9SS type A sorting domain-containing protein [Candidatus Cloacimonadaceae bacterium]